jgi:hypothetical protein
MPEFHLTHVALVGARMPAFSAYGIHDRNQLTMRLIVPDDGGQLLADIPEPELPFILRAQFPLWIHNIISDPDFPRRDQLEMPLRRFEGELCDSKNDEVVAAVLSAGFRNQPLDPLNLPAVMPLRQRCTIVMNIPVWQEAYRTLERAVIDVLCTNPVELDQWCKLQREAPLAAAE